MSAVKSLQLAVGSWQKDKTKEKRQKTKIHMVYFFALPLVLCSSILDAGSLIFVSCTLRLEPCTLILFFR
jgi:hypothetical protein